MKWLWLSLYLALFAFSVWGGTRPFDASHSNADWVFIAISFLFFGVLPILVVWDAYKHRACELLRSSLFRGFKGLWWKDPLQCLFLTTLLMGGNFLGALFTLPNDDAKQTTIVYWKASMLLGLLIGDLVTWLRFRSVIT
jgi:hypothetical protein